MIAFLMPESAKRPKQDKITVPVMGGDINKALEKIRILKEKKHGAGV
jgi:hypothetical protein